MSAIAPEKLRADLFLLHAPSVYDFRNRDDLLFAYLSDSDAVNVTSIYEMYPLGFLAMQSRLKQSGIDAQIVNVASLMLLHQTLDVDKLLGRLEAPVFGIDLHWMPHCHGSIELAKRVKAIHPEALVIFGGISSTYWADELIRYPCVDVVVKGYDTLEPVAALMETVKRGDRSLSDIPNLVYKKPRSSDIETNGFSHKPKAYNDVAIDWSFYGTAKDNPSSDRSVMLLPNTGCCHDCNWCGGSRYSTSRLMQVKKTIAHKPSRRILDELITIKDNGRETALFPLQCYSESRARMYELLDAVKQLNIKSISFEQFHLPDDDMLKRMGQSARTFLMLSPESHDHRISQLAGRGTYTMDELEAWIPRALDAGIAGILVWFFIGMREQTRQSVLDTVAYCERLLKKFPGKNIVPALCPMVPFLDPGSRFYEEPEAHGYRIFHKTLEEHRQALLRPLWLERMNYETIWMSRRDIQEVSYQGVRRLIEIKGALGEVPETLARRMLTLIDETTALLAEAERALALDGKFPESLRATIRSYNARILTRSSDQIHPMRVALGGRWYDNYTVPREIIEACSTGPEAARASV